MAQLVEALRYKPESRGSDFRWSHLNFSLTYSFWPHYGPGVDSACNRNEYQEYSLGRKGGQWVGLTTWQLYRLHLPIVFKSGSLNLLEPLRPVKASNGIALLLLYLINPLKTNDRPLDLKSQSVPRCKHFSSRLWKPISLWCKWHKSLFVLR